MMILTNWHSISQSAAWAAMAVYAAVAWRGGTWSAQFSQRLMLVAWVIHALVVWGALFWAGDTPRFGFAPALSASVWTVLAFYSIERHWFTLKKARLIMTSLGGLTLALSLWFPGPPLRHEIGMLSLLHLVSAIAAYGLISAAVMHAVVLSGTERLVRKAAAVPAGTLPLLALEKLTMRLVCVGFALLSITLLLGMVFAEQLYGLGKSWRWNHKTVFALLSWLTLATLLWVRFQLGWRGKKAWRLLYLSAGLLLLSYVGSNFVLEVVLGRSTA